ncbi:restriction endonuclease subunit S [Escherichia coli]|uniref:restriction endonuclease subunit S n=1 Tax=Escherichia coli TaxID=562 RepID=UPI0013726755|nr:restriction endonuclease subunit S [Escherichia coli]EES4555758.1 restriction endonuclease subunit S [Escherichia coli]EEY7908254.1 restriction endonuclease subunit S [Escherichia coli]EHH4262353.1 restriction endonuclease subunit S [Escherichia coli]MEB7208589.1 restriction endonuclease subunit S [Escherichia coli]NAP98521.1 restriction endonuclease subunit S [Escherichia coli]
MSVEKLIVDHMETWTSALQTRSTAGRGSSGKIDLYGIKKLRELILELAVRGKLVPQDPNDEPASELLKRIAAEKAELVKQGKIKKQKPLPEISEEEKPFELPEGWEWVRISEIGHDWGQKTPDKDFTYIDVGSINKEYGIIEEPSILSAKDAPSRARKIVQQGTIIYSTVRPYLLNIAIIENEILPEPIASTAFAIIHPYTAMDANFIYYYLRSPVFVCYVENCQTGVAYPAINDKQFFSGITPVPPSLEQVRIANKIKELMSLCDQLEQQSLTSLDAHQQLVETLLGTLTDSQTAEELAENWARISEYFDTLFTTEASVDALKQTILQLAVMGKLVPQDPNDEPASELLKRIAQEKAQLVKEGKIKKQKPLPPISDEEKPFELPDGWEWCRLGDIVTIRGGKRVANGYKLLTTATPHIYIRVSDMKDGTIDLSDLRYIDSNMHEKISNYIIKKEDIYMTIVGATIGKCGLIPPELDGMNLTENAARLTPHDKLSKEYLYQCLRSNFCQNQFTDKTLQVGVQKMALNRLSNTLIPLAPSMEAAKIIDNIKKIEDISKAMLKKIQSAQQTQLHLADALTDAAIN